MTSDIIEVVRGLGLGTRFQTFRRYGEVVEAVQGFGRSVLVSSEISLNPGATDIIRHCSLLVGIDSTRFSIVTPSRDGKDYKLNFIASDWEAKLCHGIIFV